MDLPPPKRGDVLDTARPRLLLAVFCFLLWLPGFFTLPPTDRDESRFAQASKQMIETGDYVRIMNGTEPRNRKPIGIYWLQAPAAAAARVLGLAAGNPVWPYRVPSLAGGLLAVLATYEIGRSTGGRRAALLAAGMLAASVILAVETHMAKTDAALLGATTVAMAVLARAYLAMPVGRAASVLFWAAMGAGVLLKGPITPMVAGLAALTLCGFDRRARWLLALRPVSGVAILLAMVLPWFVAIQLATHGAFVNDAVGGDLANKLASGDDAHGAPPGFHLLLLPILAFPASLIVLRSLPGWWRTRHDAAGRFLLAWIIPSWFVFEAVPTKLPHYTLPLYPAVMLLAARIACSALPAPGWWRLAASGVTVGAAALLGVAAVVLPIVVHAPVWLGLPVLAAAAIAGYAALSPRPGLGLAAMPLLTWSLLDWELPHTVPLWLAPQIARVMQDSGLAGRPLAVAGFHEPSVMFLVGTNTVLSPTGAAAADALAGGQAAAAAVSNRDEASFQTEAARAGLHVSALATLQGFNYSRGRDTTLTLYSLARDHP